MIDLLKDYGCVQEIHHQQKSSNFNFKLSEFFHFCTFYLTCYGPLEKNIPTWYLSHFHNGCSVLIHFVYRPSKTSCSITDGVKKKNFGVRGRVTTFCCVVLLLLHENTTPPHPLSPKRLRSVCVCVSECVLTRVKDLVGKQTKTHAVATLPSLASRHPPYHKPQPNSRHASHTHTHLHPMSSCQRSTLICPQGANYLLYCNTRSPEITSQSKIIRYYCPAAHWHCAINKAIVEGRSLFGHRIIDSLTDLLCALSLPLSLPFLSLSWIQRAYSTLLLINRWAVCLPSHSGLMVNRGIPEQRLSKQWLHKGTVPKHTLETSPHTFTNSSHHAPPFISPWTWLVFLVDSVNHMSLLKNNNFADLCPQVEAGAGWGLIVTGFKVARCSISTLTFIRKPQIPAQPQSHWLEARDVALWQHKGDCSYLTSRHSVIHLLTACLPWGVM